MTLEEEVLAVLQDEENIEFEDSLDVEDSPLNQPVSEGDIGLKEKTPEPVEEEETQEEHTDELELDFGEDNDDVPEQEIHDREDVFEEEIEDDFELPNAHAKQLADTIIGVSDNLLAIGGGMFIKIKKHKDFYEFDEVIQIIDEQNQKNIKRLCLDEHDKLLLRPLLIEVLKKKSQKFSPEQQLLGVLVSILMKKGQIIVEIRAENEILVERLLDLIREEKGLKNEEEVTEEPEDVEEVVAEEAA